MALPQPQWAYTEQVNACRFLSNQKSGLLYKGILKALHCDATTHVNIYQVRCTKYIHRQLWPDTRYIHREVWPANTFTDKYSQKHDTFTDVYGQTHDTFTDVYDQKHDTFTDV